MDLNLNNQNDQWELNLDIHDSDLRLTPVYHPYRSTRVETSTTTQKPVRIIPGPVGDIKNFLKNGKLDQVIAIVKSCTSNVLSDLTVTLKDLSGTVFHKDRVLGSGSGVGGSGMLDEEEIVKLLKE
ncbi:hypothetical protein Tco_0977178 [Tanacetum coccineum]|uniref:Uncharacterized protein n=1 Tax=Tanacetum coccineum TaxID=301880 RepID=A0ABQ5EJC6_9ASTR